MKDLLSEINYHRNGQTNTRLVLCQPSNLLPEYLVNNLTSTRVLGPALHTTRVETAANGKQ